MRQDGIAGGGGPRFLAEGPRRTGPADVAQTPLLRRRIAVALDGVPLKEALAQIAARGGFELAYSEDVLPAASRVRLHAAGITVAAALTDVLADARADVVLTAEGRVVLRRQRAGAGERRLAGTLGGRVTDGATGQPLPGARVVLVGTAFAALTGQDGRYTFARLPAGSYTVRVAYIGRRAETRQVTVSDGAVTEADLVLAVSTLPTQVVQGVRARGQAEALSRQQNAPNIASIVASDQMGRFPDASAPEAVQRLPGVAIDRDQGEGRYIRIRGGAPQNTQVTFNGEQVPSPEGDSRQIALDAVPVDILESIEVHKAITPDMDADAIGGSVNLVTRKAPDARLFSFEGAGGYASIRERGSGSGALTFGERRNGGRFGYLFSGSFSRRNFGSDGIEPEYDIGDPGAADDVLAGVDVRYYSLWRARLGGTASLDYRLGANSGLYLTGVFSELQDEEQRRRLINVVEDDALEYAHKARRENLRTVNVTGGGSHLLRSGLGVNYHMTFARSGEDTPYDSELTFVREDVSFAPDLSDPDRPRPNPTGGVGGTYLFDAFEPASSQTRNRDLVGALDLTRPYTLGAGAGTLKFGGKLRERRKDRDVVERAFELGDDADDIDLGAVGTPFTPVGFNPGAYALPPSVTSGAAVRGFANRFASSIEREDVIEADAEDYDLRERTGALYVMATHNLTPRLLLLPGVRYEYTWFDGTGYAWDSEEETLTRSDRTASYGRFFPMLHARYRIDDRTNVRAAFTTAIARPNFYDLVPYRVRDDEDLTLGNTDLKPTTSRNLDFMLERYDERVGLLSAGVFYKRLQNPIFPFTEENDLGGETTQPRNVASAEIRGVELALQQRLRFLPGAFAGLGVYANYTYTDSEARLPGGLETRLPGQADHVVNGALSYEVRRFSAQVSVNYQDNYVLELGGDSGDAEEREDDLVVDSRAQVDLSASYFLTPRAQLFFDALNLTNQPYVTFQSIPTRPRQREFYEPWVELGLRFRW